MATSCKRKKDNWQTLAEHVSSSLGDCECEIVDLKWPARDRVDSWCRRDRLGHSATALHKGTKVQPWMDAKAGGYGAEQVDTVQPWLAELRLPSARAEGMIR